MVRIHGHSSAYTAYECIHEPRFNSVFNITNNYGCGGFCGGGVPRIGGFWNSFAYGFGNGLSNLFGGFGGMFGGMFGGGMGMFPMFNMFGMGNMFGGGMGMFPWLSMFGGGGSKPATASTVTCSCGCSGTGKGAGVTDADNVLIEDYESKIKALSGDKDKAQAQTYYNDILKLRKNPKDDVNKTQNQLAYQELLDQLKKKYPDLKTDEVEEVDEVHDNDQEDNDGNWSKVTLPSGVTIEDLKSKGIKVVPLELKGGLTYCLSLPSPMTVEAMKLLAKAGLPVAMGYNSNSACKDHWIAGKITLANDFSETNFKWDINCSGYGKYGNTYSVERPDKDKADDFKISVKSKTTGKKLKGGAEYKLSTYNGAPTLTRDGKPVYTEQETTDTDYED